MASETRVIVGGGLAGAKAAETLRSEAFDGRMLIVGAEPERPYERPTLSKDCLRRDAGRATRRRPPRRARDAVCDMGVEPVEHLGEEVGAPGSTRPAPRTVPTPELNS